MSLRLEMLQVARLAPTVLGPEACELIERFIYSRQDASTGGFCDRDGEADLYYTSFAIDALTALQVDLPEESLTPFLLGHLDAVEALDFVHRCCLARCLSAFPALAKAHAEKLATLHQSIEAFRTPDGGYNETPESETGSAYAAFLAWGAWSDHGTPPPEPERIVESLRTLATEDGAWANDTFIPVPNVPATAAAITLCRNLREPIPEATTNWILGCFHPAGGGFVPFPGAPMPDLLTTAVALHALDGLQAEFGALKEPILDFIDTLWTAEGGFYGTWDDEPEELDIEYTYYGLLALGHLAL